MNAAITSVYIVIAVWTPWMDVFRSATICEIETFMTLESSTMTNCAAPRITSGSQLRFSDVLSAGAAVASVAAIACDANYSVGGAPWGMAPGGVEPPREASKASALSTELRGRADEA